MILVRFVAFVLVCFASKGHKSVWVYWGQCAFVFYGAMMAPSSSLILTDRLCPFFFSSQPAAKRYLQHTKDLSKVIFDKAWNQLFWDSAVAIFRGRISLSEIVQAVSIFLHCSFHTKRDQKNLTYSLILSSVRKISWKESPPFLDPYIISAFGKEMLTCWFYCQIILLSSQPLGHCPKTSEGAIHSLLLTVLQTKKTQALVLSCKSFHCYSKALHRLHLCPHMQLQKARSCLSVSSYSSHAQGY